MIILLTGLPGTGKTEVAKILSKNIPDSIILRNDEIRRELFGVEQGKGFSEDQTALIDATVIQKTAAAIGNKQTVILDRMSPTAQDRTKLRDVAATLGTPCVILAISSSRSLAEKRITERLQKDPLGVPFSVYLYWLDTYEPCDQADYSIVNDSDLDALEQSVRAIVNQLQ